MERSFCVTGSAVVAARAKIAMNRGFEDVSPWGLVTIRPLRTAARVDAIQLAGQRLAFSSARLSMASTDLYRGLFIRGYCGGRCCPSVATDVAGLADYHGSGDHLGVADYIETVCSWCKLTLRQGHAGWHCSDSSR